MSSKKSFCIADDLANGIKHSVQSASENYGQLHYDMIPINIIESDSNNPRKLNIAYTDIINGFNESDINYQKKCEELEALNELAESIKIIGIRNAIEVYKDNSEKYKIISGERRYLASILAGQNYIPARISQKPAEFKLRYMQWVENINRKDLSLWEKYNNLISISNAVVAENKTNLDVQTLKTILGVSDAQAYRYFYLLNAEAEIVDLIKAEKLTNLKVVQALVCSKNVDSKNKILTNIAREEENIGSLNKFKNLTEKSQNKNFSFRLGSSRNIAIARYIFDTLLSNSNLNKYTTTFEKTDWSSIKSINQTFKSLFKFIEKELNVKEPINED